MGAPKDFATKLQAGTGAAHLKSFIKYLKNFEFEKPLVEHAPNQRLIYEPKGVCALITPWTWPMNQVCLVCLFFHFFLKMTKTHRLSLQISLPYLYLLYYPKI